MIIPQQPAKSFATLDLTASLADFFARLGEHESFLALCFQHSVELSLVELDDLLLLAMHSADEKHAEELPRLKNEVHGRPDGDKKQP